MWNLIVSVPDYLFIYFVRNYHVSIFYLAKTLRPSDLHNLRRNGVRTIPLPGDKRLLIKWGELKSQQVKTIKCYISGRIFSNCFSVCVVLGFV